MMSARCGRLHTMTATSTTAAHPGDGGATAELLWERSINKSSSAAQLLSDNKSVTITGCVNTGYNGMRCQEPVCIKMSMNVSSSYQQIISWTRLAGFHDRWSFLQCAVTNTKLWRLQ